MNNSTTPEPQQPGQFAPAPGSAYWDIWKHMADNHNLILLETECEDICRVVEKTRLPLLTRHISGDLVLMCALVAMSEPTSSSERAKFTERLLARLHQFEASRSSKSEPSNDQAEPLPPGASVADTEKL